MIVAYSRLIGDHSVIFNNDRSSQRIYKYHSEMKGTNSSQNVTLHGKQ